MESSHFGALSERADVELVGIWKRFGATEALRDVSLRVRPGEFLCLLGPSGCGKTTLLRIVAGLARPDGGQVVIRGRDVTDTPPFARSIGLVFQNYALFPHMTVAENIGFGLQSRGMRGPKVDQRTTWALDLLQLSGLQQRYPRQLSGGQQQRVALARALVLNPDVLLLDEPLSNLDARLRQEVRLEIRRLQRELGITTIFVTHDQEEALTLSDRIVVLRAGAIVQEGDPLAVYLTPKDLFVANFVGDSNILRGHVAHGENGMIFSTDRGLQISLGSRPTIKGGSMLMLRPEAIDLSKGSRSLPNCFSGRVASVEHKGPTIEFGIELQSADYLRVLRTLPGHEYLKVDDQVWVCWEEGQGVLLPVDDGGASA
jgi:putative spermidine/putrescine transport system ATP-binding protein